MEPRMIRLRRVFEWEPLTTKEYFVRSDRILVMTRNPHAGSDLWIDGFDPASWPCEHLQVVESPEEVMQAMGYSVRPACEEPS